MNSLSRFLCVVCLQGRYCALIIIPTPNPNPNPYNFNPDFDPSPKSQIPEPNKDPYS